MSSWSLRMAAVLLGVLCLACGASGTVSTAAPAGERLVITDGHVDMGPRMVNGTWQIQLRDDTSSPPTWRELDDVILRATDDAKITVPAGDTYRFLGAAGDPVWVLPQVQRAGIVWPGWNSQDPSVVDGISGPITWTVRSVEGPGTFTLFLNDAFGAPTTIFDGTRRYPQSTAIEPNTHAHGNWTFSKPGVYRLVVEMQATAKNGSALTDTQTLALAVGDADPRQVPRGGTDPGATTGSGNPAQSLPNTGASDVALLAGGGAALLIVAQVLRWGLRRRVRGR
ncbi:MAG: TIGR03773 family transporter-associated surface protein [Pseudonocardiaceae bacterium]